MNTITHIVQIFLDIERPSIGKYNLDLPEKWVKYRIEFFNKFTLPSLLNQTFQDFRIFLICGNKHKKLTSNFNWNKRVEVCYGKGKGGTIATGPGYPEPGLKVEEFMSIDTDYIAITRLDSDDLFHKEAMADVRNSIIMTDKRRCLMFRKYLVWDMVNRYIRPIHHKRSPPFITHIFPKSIYKDYDEFASQHFVSHRFAGGKAQETVELPTDRICVVNHENNISRIKKNRRLMLLSKEERDEFKKKETSYIYDIGNMARILRNFSVSKTDIEGDNSEIKIAVPGWEKADIIFLTHNHSDMSLECLNALKKNTHHPFRLIWIDNGSEMTHYRKIREKVEEFNHISHRFDTNRFYARAVNQGIIMSNARHIVTLSNDVLVTDGWLGKLLAIMERDPKVGLLSPLTDKIGSPVCKVDFAVQKWNLRIYGDYCEQINRLPERYGITSSSISMFCSVIRNELVEKIGLLDERFFILGNDDDYCDRARLAGFKTAICLNCFVYHKHSATKDLIFRPDSIERMAIKRDHQALLKEKRLERAKTGLMDIVSIKDRTFQIIVDIFTRYQCKWWLDAGVCLGVVRDGNFLSFKDDIDIGLPSIHINLWDMLIEDFKAVGFRLEKERVYKGRKVTMRFKGCGAILDIYFYYEQGKYFWHPIFGRDDNGRGGKYRIFRVEKFSKHLFSNLQPIIFKERKCFLPNPPEQYLSERYGGDWKIPDPDYRYWKDCKAIDENFLNEEKIECRK